eukprot:scaffold5351_cov63-Phaeocystis_antarctica.AAC.2
MGGALSPRSRQVSPQSTLRNWRRKLQAATAFAALHTCRQQVRSPRGVTNWGGPARAAARSVRSLTLSPSHGHNERILPQSRRRLPA